MVHKDKSSRIRLGSRFTGITKQEAPYAANVEVVHESVVDLLERVAFADDAAVHAD